MTRIVDRAAVSSTAVGASEVGAVIGCDPWTSPLALYRRKRGLDAELADNAAMRAGRALEGPIVDLARSVIPLPIRRNRRTFMHPGGRLFATPDAFAGSDRLVEVKLVGVHAALDEWSGDDLPCRIRLQAQAQLAVTGRDAVYVAALVGTELRLTVVERDPVLVEELLRLVGAFVDDLRLGIAPDPLAFDERWEAIAEQLRGAPRVDVLAGGELQLVGDRLLDLRRARGRIEDEERELRLELATALGPNGSRLVGNGWTASVQETLGRVDYRTLYTELVELAGVDGGRLADLVAAHRSSPTTSIVVRSTGDSSRD